MPARVTDNIPRVGVGPNPVGYVAGAGRAGRASGSARTELISPQGAAPTNCEPSFTFHSASVDYIAVARALLADPHILILDGDLVGRHRHRQISALG